MTNTSTQPSPGPGLTVREVAAALGLSVNSVYSHLKAGHIVGYRLGAKRYVRREEIERIQQLGMPRLPKSEPTPAAEADPLS